MITIRRAGERGRTRIGWLDSQHTFSFGEYHDPRHMGFRSLRVINDDVIAPGSGFGTHGHRDMEIVSIALSGALEHRDSLGTGSVIRPGEVQRMTAGTGVMHSEMNASATEPAHFLQIWILPERRGLEPGYEQTSFDTRARPGEWILVASRNGHEGSVTIHQDASIRRAHLPSGDRVETTRAPDRHGWLHVAAGRVRMTAPSLAETELSAGDGVALAPGERATLEGLDDADLLLFDLA